MTRQWQPTRQRVHALRNALLSRAILGCLSWARSRAPFYECKFLIPAIFPLTVGPSAFEQIGTAPCGGTMTTWCSLPAVDWTSNPSHLKVGSRYFLTMALIASRSQATAE